MGGGGVIVIMCVNNLMACFSLALCSLNVSGTCIEMDGRMLFRLKAYRLSGVKSS